jgi:hypothetical protein
MNQSVTLDIRFARDLFVRYRLASRARVVTAHSGSYRLPAFTKNATRRHELNRIESLDIVLLVESVYQSLTMVC